MCQKKKCYFVTYTNKWLNIECITYDEEFWQKQMETKLENFYMNCILPEIINPQYGKRLLVDDIKDPKEDRK